VRVYVPSTLQVETNIVTDPYSTALTTDSTRSGAPDLAEGEGLENQKRYDFGPTRPAPYPGTDAVRLAGDPGVGKSPLLLDVAARAADVAEGSGRPPVLYVTGEESASQVRLRAERIGALHPHLYLAAESDLGKVLGHVKGARPSLLVVDSVQTIADPRVDGSAGGVAQVRAVTSALVSAAKSRGLPVLLVGHVTKDGSIAGPRVVAHLVAGGHDGEAGAPGRPVRRRRAGAGGGHLSRHEDRRSGGRRLGCAAEAVGGGVEVRPRGLVLLVDLRGQDAHVPGATVDLDVGAADGSRNLGVGPQDGVLDSGQQVVQVNTELVGSASQLRHIDVHGSLGPLWSAKRVCAGLSDDVSP